MADQRQPRTTTRTTRAAFALAELLTLVALLAVTVILLLVTAGESRRNARLGDDIAKVRFIASASTSYFADNTELMWTFSAPGGLPGAADQAVDIMRRRSGNPNLPRIPNWIPQMFYNHLVLVDYLDTALPDRMFISSGDAHRHAWVDDPECFYDGCFLPNQPNPDFLSFRWLYSASFTPPAAFYDLSAPEYRIRPLSTGSYEIASGTVLGPTDISAVAFPSMKVLVTDRFAYHFGKRQPFSVHDEARLPLLFVDGSVSVRAAVESNPGWRPRQPTNSSPSVFTHTPSPWEPRAISTSGIDLLTGRFLWTRGGLAGRDFGGKEIRPLP